MDQHEGQCSEGKNHGLESLLHVRDVVDQANHCSHEEDADGSEKWILCHVSKEFLYPDHKGQTYGKSEKGRDSTKLCNLGLGRFVDVLTHHAACPHFPDEGWHDDENEHEREEKTNEDPEAVSKLH